MSKYQTPYRYDFVGKFFKTARIKKQKQITEGKITKEEYDHCKGSYRSCSKAKRAWIPCDYRRRIQKNLLASGFYVGI